MILNLDKQGLEYLFHNIHFHNKKSSLGHVIGTTIQWTIDFIIYQNIQRFISFLYDIAFVTFVSCSVISRN